MPKDFITLADWSAEELRAILDRARELKMLGQAGKLSGLTRHQSEKMASHAPYSHELKGHPFAVG